MANFEKYKYCSIANQDSEELTYTPIDGEEIYLEEVGCSGGCVPSVKSEVFWGTELLFASHMTANRHTKKVLIGDNTTVLKILLTNNSDTAETIGGHILGTHTGFTGE